LETRSPYPTDISDEEWAFVAPYLTLLPEDAAQRKYTLREVFNGGALHRQKWRALAADAA
jgi:transposase